MLFADQINQLTINATYKNKIKTYCLKCKKDTKNLDSKIFRTKNSRLLINQNVVIAEIKSHDL